MKISDSLLSLIKSGEASLTLLIEISGSNFELYLNTSDIELESSEHVYVPLSIESSLIFEGISNPKSQINLSISKELLENLESILNASVVIKMADAEDLESASIIHKGVISVYNDLQNGLIGLTISSILLKTTFPKGEYFSETCRACLGDSKCKKCLDNFSKTGKVSGVLAKDKILGTHEQMQSRYFDYGTLKFTSGTMSTKVFQIRNENDGTIVLMNSINGVSVGDDYIMYAGCDKLLSTCRDKFDNVINFRGEPFIKESE